MTAFSGAPEGSPKDVGRIVESIRTVGRLQRRSHFQIVLGILIVMIPDYPTDKAPVWRESFAVDQDVLRQLCETMAVEGLWTEKWQALAQPPIGGSSESLVVTAGRQMVIIPSFPIAHQRQRV